MFSRRGWITPLASACMGFLVVGCANNPTNSGASMHAGNSHMIGCGGAGKTWGDCTQIATRECGGGGFDVIKRSAPETSASSAAQGAAVADGFDATTDTNDRWMEVTCTAH